MKSLFSQRLQHATIPYHSANQQVTRSSSSTRSNQSILSLYFKKDQNPPAQNPNYVPESNQDSAEMTNLDLFRSIIQLPKEIDEKKAEITQLKHETEQKKQELKQIQSNGKMAINISRHRDLRSDIHAEQKAQIRAQLFPELDEKLQEYESLELEIIQITTQLNQLSTDVDILTQSIHEKISNPSDMICFHALNPYGFTQEQTDAYKKFQNQFSDLKSKINIQNQKLSDLNSEFNYDQYLSNLKKHNVSLLLSTESMSKGKYTYELKTELKQNRFIDAFSEFSEKIESDANYIRNHKRLVQIIVKIQTEVNKSESSHLITKKYVDELMDIGILKVPEDAESFVQKVIVASIHKNPLSKYRNQKTATISDMILKFNELLQEKRNSISRKVLEKVGENKFQMQFYFSKYFDFSKRDFKRRILELCKMLKKQKLTPLSMTEQGLKDIGCFNFGSEKTVLEQMLELHWYSNIPGVFDPIEQLISDLENKIHISSYRGQEYLYLGSVTPGQMHTFFREEESDAPWGLGGKYLVQETYTDPATANNGYLYGENGQIILEIKNGREKGDYDGTKVYLR